MIYRRLHLEAVVGLYTLGKSSNRSTRNFDILVKLETVRTIPLFQAKVLYNRGISQNIIMIYQFPEFVSHYKDRFYHSIKSEVKKHLNHLKV